jgi:hypothetical protein
MTFSVITDKKGKIIFFFKGRIKDYITGDNYAYPVIEKEQKLHEIEVPDNFGNMKPEELHKNFPKYLK